VGIEAHPLTLIALVCAGLAAVILVSFLVRRPALVGATKVWLLIGLGVLPLGAAAAGNIQGYQATKQRKFCGSCHVMVPHASDSEDVSSGSLASRHARNALFGGENCYVCHADYGMFGTILTKLGGLKHVYMYATHYRDISLEEAKKTIRLYKPYPNENCMQCHSTQLDLWLRTPDHKSALTEVRENRISCASAGCHGFAHPFTKAAPDEAKLSAGPATTDAPARSDNAHFTDQAVFGFKNIEAR
jgi:nitrate/TMAO reductase-like tetraheme cytochrome c subunit